MYVSVDSVSPAGIGSVYLVPISTTTGKAGKPMRFPGSVLAVLITPDGKTAYVIGQEAVAASLFANKITVTPISTATNTVGHTVIAGSAYVEDSAVMTPDGQHIYISTANPFSLIQFSTATNTAGSQISFRNSEIMALAAAPNGQTVYVASELQTHDTVRCPAAKGLVTPVVTATGRPGKPVPVGCTPNALAVTPDGKTIYVASWAHGSSQGIVTPIAAATGQAGTPIRVNGDPRAILILP
jgi:DNA-binding beta-propeller fold protein YncE